VSWLSLWLYAGWTLLLLAAIVGLRVYLSTTHQRAPNRFAPSGDDVSPLSGRLCRAHANCYENLPVVGALLVVAGLTDNLDITDSTALVLVAARIAQSVVHVCSTSNRAVTVRFTFFAVQIAIAGSWVLRLGLRLL